MGTSRRRGTGDAEVVAMLRLSADLHSLVTIRDEEDEEDPLWPPPNSCFEHPRQEAPPSLALI